MPDYHIPLLPGEIYHILSRAIGDEKLFRQDRNYRFFLLRYEKYIAPMADTFCYCLLPNHFHILSQIKEEKVLSPHFRKIRKKQHTQEMIPGLVMKQFSNFLNSYTKAYNNTYHRKGGLFIDYLRRAYYN